MRRVNIVVILALSSISLGARAQTKDANGSAIGKVEKAPPSYQVANYPCVLDMTFPEFGAAVMKTDIVLVPIGAIEEHGPDLSLATDSILALAQLVDVQLLANCCD